MSDTESRSSIGRNVWRDGRVSLRTRPPDRPPAPAPPPIPEPPVSVDADTLVWIAGLYLEHHGWHQNTNGCWSNPPRAAGLTLGQALDLELESEP